MASVKEKRFLLWVVAITAAIAPAGLAGDGVVKIHTGDPACPDGSSNRFVGCGNGTVTDTRTGLVWLANANCIGDTDWPTAVQFAAGLSDLTDVTQDCGLTDGSSPGEWRIPTIREFLILTLHGMICPGPDITNDAGDACWSEGPGSSFIQVAATEYWTSEPRRIAPDVSAFQWHLVGGGGGGWSSTDRTNLLRVWPVRGARAD